MKILVVTRDIAYGIGTTVKNLVWQHELRDDVERIVVVAPETFPVKTNKVEFVHAPIKGTYFFTKEIVFGFVAARKIRELLKKEKFDAIHLHSNIFFFGKPDKSLLGNIISTFQVTHNALTKLKFPIISTFHNTHMKLATLNMNNVKYEVGKYGHYPFIPLDRIRVNSSKIVTCVSTATLDEIKNYPNAKKKSFVFLPNGVDTDLFMPQKIDKYEFWKKNFNIDLAGKKILLYVGRLESGKGTETFRRVMQEMTNAHLVCIGDGPEKDSLEEIKNISCVGFVGDLQTKSQAYAASDMFVFASLYENFPAVVVEAMASGLPVLSTKVGMNHYVLQDDNRVLVKPGDANEFAEKLKTILADEKLMKELGEKNLQFALENLSWKKIADNYINLYKKLNE